MDHYRNPRNKGLVEDDEYVTIFLRNPSCGDDLTVQVKANGDKIESIRQYGTGCSICCSSASMMSELLASKTLTEAAQLINQFYLMVEAKPYDEEALGDAISLQGVAKCSTYNAPLWAGKRAKRHWARSRKSRRMTLRQNESK